MSQVKASFETRHPRHGAVKAAGSRSSAAREEKGARRPAASARSGDRRRVMWE
jgi:hypothetical protein